MESKPTWLDRRAQALYDQLEATGFAGKQRELSEMLCHAYSVYLEAETVIRREGRYIKCGTGSTKCHPATSIQKDAFNQFRRIAKDLGLLAAPSKDDTPMSMLSSFLETR